jgi:GNAT superfamily N-acetyltransferase
LAYRITVSESPTTEEITAITDPLREYNLQHVSPPNFLPLALLLQDDEERIIGGLSGRSAYDWLFIDYLVLPTELRGKGLGTDLMNQAEDIARQRGCTGIWLDTFSFQALPFYEKLGYQRFGQIDDYPRGHTRYFLQKRLSH